MNRVGTMIGQACVSGAARYQNATDLPASSTDNKNHLSSKYNMELATSRETQGPHTYKIGTGTSELVPHSCEFCAMLVLDMSGTPMRSIQGVLWEPWQPRGGTLKERLSALVGKKKKALANASGIKSFRWQLTKSAGPKTRGILFDCSLWRLQLAGRSGCSFALHVYKNLALGRVDESDGLQSAFLFGRITTDTLHFSYISAASPTEALTGYPGNVQQVPQSLHSLRLLASAGMCASGAQTES